MNTHVQKTQKGKSHSVTNNFSKKQTRKESTFQFVDNRSEAISQRKLQEIANNRPKVQQFKTLQTMRNSNFQLEKIKGTTGFANNKSEETIQRLAIGDYDDYEGYLNGDGMIRNPPNVGYFVGLLRAGRPLPMDADPMTAAMGIEMIATPDDEANYINAEEYEGEDQPEKVTKNVLLTGHHRFAAYVEEKLDLPPIGYQDYAMSGYNWRDVPGANYDLKDADIPEFSPLVEAHDNADQLELDNGDIFYEDWEPLSRQAMGNIVVTREFDRPLDELMRIAYDAGYTPNMFTQMMENGTW